MGIPENTVFDWRRRNHWFRDINTGFVQPAVKFMGIVFIFCSLLLIFQLSIWFFSRLGASHTIKQCRHKEMYCLPKWCLLSAEYSSLRNYSGSCTNGGQ